MLFSRQLQPGSPQAQLAAPRQGSAPASSPQSLPALPERSAASRLPPAWLSRQFPSQQKLLVAAGAAPRAFTYILQIHTDPLRAPRCSWDPALTQAPTITLLWSKIKVKHPGEEQAGLHQQRPPNGAACQPPELPSPS